jgi:hypothetical protein
LAAILRRGIRARVTCSTGGRFDTALALTDAVAKRLNTDQVVWYNSGRIRKAGGSVVISLRPRHLPTTLTHARRLTMDLWSAALATGSDPGDFQFAAGIDALRLFG